MFVLLGTNKQHDRNDVNNESANQYKLPMAH